MNEKNNDRTHTVHANKMKERHQLISHLFNEAWLKYRKDGDRENLINLCVYSIIFRNYLNEFLNNVTATDMPALEESINSGISIAETILGSEDNATIKTRFNQEQGNGTSPATVADINSKTTDKRTEN